AGVDDFGCCDDDYGLSARDQAVARLIPAEWFLGPKRGLLSALTVGTVDHLLYAATRTRHVMLRHAGLAGRVVVLDEVHAYDVYMSQFLFEALRWLADAGVPVVLLSATLPPQLRRRLVTAYLQGALARRDLDLSALPAAEGYPNALTVCAVDGEPRFDTRAAAPWRPSAPVGVHVLPEDPADGPDAVVAVLREALREGGCALVVRNTVRRAQQTYAAVKAVFGVDAVLLHARMTAGDRADRTDRVLRLLGAPDREGAPARPPRLVVVATQLAEQSFDVDADLLITDLAPIDLLLQRVGRLHRHARPDEDRKAPVRTPRVVVAGMAPQTDGPPRFPGGSRAVYGEYLLLRSAALVIEAAQGSGWNVPADVPALVAHGYTEDVGDLPESWREPAAAAYAQWAVEQDERAANAAQYLLSSDGALGTPTLAGLHDRSVAAAEDDALEAAVRDGDESIEVVLVRRSDRGYATLAGRPLGPDGGVAVSDPEVLDEVARCSVRLPPYATVTAAAQQTLRPLPGWGLDPWLRRARALPLDDDLAADLGGYRFRYSEELGLLDERLTGRTG
ncbi:helicase-related protein, partial [Pseudonocardia sp.]|uniref:helicase-related protein n=1 Tax=Pseudonocardia sp. TaxID=60912 RepID=UPI0029F9EAFC|nr:CRISPR-associated helicase, Cas3 family [Pseudonocardia sp.]